MTILTRGIYKLPAELLIELFRSCMEAEGGSVELDLRRAPWTWTRVDRRWQYVVSHMHELWTRYNIDLESQPSLTCLERALAYASSLLISFEVSAMCGTNIELMSPHPIIECLVRHSDRWQCATLALPTMHIMTLSEARHGFPHLEELYFRPTGRDFVYQTIPRFDALREAPRLRNVDITGVGSSLYIDLPWKRLSSFSADVCYFADLLSEDLAFATNLTRLGLTIHNDSVGEIPLAPTYAKLKYLTLRLGEDANSEELLSSSNFPALESLCLELQNGYDTIMDHYADVELLITNNNILPHTLTVLSITLDNYAISCDVSRVLKLTPKLRELHLHALNYRRLIYHSISLSLLQELTVSPAKHLLSGLEVLSLSGTLCPKELKTMLMSRIISLSPTLATGAELTTPALRTFHLRVYEKAVAEMEQVKESILTLRPDVIFYLAALQPSWHFDDLSEDGFF